MVSFKTKMRISNFLLSILCSFAHLFSIDELKNFNKFITNPRLVFSLIGLLFVWVSHNSIPIAFAIFFFVAYSNGKIFNSLVIKQNQLNVMVNSKNIELPRYTLIFSKFIGDIYWTLPGVIMQIVDSSFLLNFLLWDRITKFYLAPTVVATQALTGVLAKAPVSFEEKLKISIKNHLVIALFYSAIGYFILKYSFVLLSEDKSLSSKSLVYTVLYIFCVIMSRSMVVHGFYFSNDKRTPFLGNLILLFSCIGLFLPLVQHNMENVLLYFLSFQFLVVILYFFNSDIWRKHRMSLARP